MPKLPIQKLTVKEIEQNFDEDDDFYFNDVEGNVMTWQCRKGFIYLITFHINEFSSLRQPAKIYDITAAIDESKFYGLKMIMA